MNHDKLNQFCLAFVHKRRDDGGEFVCLAKDAPEWMTEVVKDAHGEFLPEDWRYAAIEAVANALVETVECGDDPEDQSWEIACNLTDDYTSDLTAWLATNVNRLAYCDDGAQNLDLSSGEATLVDILNAGQQTEYMEIIGSLLYADALQDDEAA